MSKALVLHGNNKTGKSTTIYELIQLFPKDSVTEIYRSRLYKSIDRKCPELSVVVKYKGKTICIITKGDDLKCVIEQINKFIEAGYDPYKCDLFVCASHSGGRLPKYLIEKFDKKVFISKEDIKEVKKQDKACKNIAKKLFKEVEELIK